MRKRKSFAEQILAAKRQRRLRAIQSAVLSSLIGVWFGFCGLVGWRQLRHWDKNRHVADFRIEAPEPNAGRYFYVQSNDPMTGIPYAVTIGGDEWALVRVLAFSDEHTSAVTYCDQKQIAYLYAPPSGGVYGH
jgi:hypothetical protein